MKRSVMAWLVLASIALGISAGIVPAYAAGAFTDVAASSAYGTAILELRAENVLEGYADGTFKPEMSINRAELLKIILEARDDGTLTGSNCFPDVKGQWFAKYVCTAKTEGIVSGYPDGTFKPEQSVSFAEASKIFSLAYKQSIQNEGGDWYVPYVRALESSQAIPATINGLVKDLSRGEMAEMMWRLRNGVTDKPSLGYMNVKYDIKVNLASDKVQVASSCVDLQAFATESKDTGGYRGGSKMMRNGVDGSAAPLMAPPALDAAEPANTTTQGVGGGGDGDYSQTNVQVAGVDEADIVKTDGTYLYIVSSSRVRIVKAVPGSAMKEMATITNTDTNFSPSVLYVSGNRLIVLGSNWREGGPIHIMGSERTMIYPYPYSTGLTQVRIYNIADKTAPVLERKVSFEGSSVSSRMIGNKLYFVVNQPIRMIEQPLDAPKAEDVLPLFEDSKLGTDSRPVTGCTSVRILPHIPQPQYLTVAVIDTSSPNTDVKRETILGNAQNVYSSTENLYVAATQWVYHWDVRPSGGEAENEEKTNLYRFAFTADGIEYKAQGSVPGHILNQFSMDEHGNTFRIATTKGELWNDQKPATNNLYLLNRDLEATGKIEDIAPSERIYSVRFMGDRAYMVTFRNTDPLFVIDTSDPRNPKILGQLKIPGYSDYLHPYDDTHIIGFGKDTAEAKDRTDFAWYQGMKIAMFDVSDVANPKELHKEIIGDRGTDSPLLHNHKALLFEKDKNLLAFPVTINEIPDSEKTKNDPSSYGSPVFQGAYVYTLTLKDGFQLKGKITHADPKQVEKMGDRWYSFGNDIQRIVRLGQSLLTVSDAVVQSSALTDLRKEGSVTFDDFVADQVYPCGRGIPCTTPMIIE